VPPCLRVHDAYVRAVSSVMQLCFVFDLADALQILALTDSHASTCVSVCLPAWRKCEVSWAGASYSCPVCCVRVCVCSDVEQTLPFEVTHLAWSPQCIRMNDDSAIDN